MPRYTGALGRSGNSIQRFPECCTDMVMIDLLRFLLGIFSLGAAQVQRRESPGHQKVQVGHECDI